jgi:hypothetical protein
MIIRFGRIGYGAWVAHRARAIVAATVSISRPTT